MLGILLLGGCAADPATTPSSISGASASPGIRGYKVGKPYQIKGIWYSPQVDYGYVGEGTASWYGPGFDGRLTANGEQYDMNDLTAAHKTLPLPSIVRVTNLDNGRSIKLRVNDRGPFVGERIIDVSRRGAQLLGFYGAGTARVRVEVVEDESRQLLASLAAASGMTVADASPVPTAPASSLVTYQPAPEAPATVAPAEIGQVPVPAEPPPPSLPVEVADIGAAPVSEGSVLFASAGAPEAVPPTAFTPAPVSPAALPAVATAPAAARVAAPSRLATAISGDRRVTWVQAGAFADSERADRARQRLRAIGPVVMVPSRQGSQELVRVRVGPLGSSADAERTLASVSHAGFPDCRLVIE